MRSLKQVPCVVVHYYWARFKATYVKIRVVPLIKQGSYIKYKSIVVNRSI